jgi:hypothetical protein
MYDKGSLLIGKIAPAKLVSVNRLIPKEALQQRQTLKFPNRERRF